MKVFMVGLTGIILLAAGVAVGQEEDAERVVWRQRFQANISGSSGNVRSYDMRAAWRARQDAARRRRFLDASYDLGVTGSEVDRSAFTSGARQDWLFPGKTWFTFGEGRYYFDDFQAWRHRASTHWGVGNEFKKTDTFELLGRAGVGAYKQWERSESIRPEALIGAETVWEMTETQEFTASSYVYPRLDRAEYRMVSKAEFNAAIDRARGMSFVTGVEHTYDSYPGAETRNWVLRYYAGISVAF